MISRCALEARNSTFLVPPHPERRSLTLRAPRCDKVIRVFHGQGFSTNHISSRGLNPARRCPLSEIRCSTRLPLSYTIAQFHGCSGDACSGWRCGTRRTVRRYSGWAASAPSSATSPPMRASAGATRASRKPLWLGALRLRALRLRAPGLCGSGHYSSGLYNSGLQGFIAQNITAECFRLRASGLMAQGFRAQRYPTMCGGAHDAGAPVWVWSFTFTVKALNDALQEADTEGAQLHEV